MTQDVSMIVEALRESSILEVRSDGVSVRTRENPTIWPITRAQARAQEEAAAAEIVVSPLFYLLFEFDFPFRAESALSCTSNHFSPLTNQE